MSQIYIELLKKQLPKYLGRKKKDENIKDKLKKVVPDFEKSSMNLKVRQKKAKKSIDVIASTNS